MVYIGLFLRMENYGQVGYSSGTINKLFTNWVALSVLWDTGCPKIMCLALKLNFEEVNFSVSEV